MLCCVFFSPVLRHDIYNTVAAIPIGALPADISFFITLSIISIAIRLVFSLIPTLFAILTMHFIGSVFGIFRSSSESNILYAFGTILPAILSARAISFSVFGIPNSLHEMYMADNNSNFHYIMIDAGNGKILSSNQLSLKDIMLASSIMMTMAPTMMVIPGIGLMMGPVMMNEPESYGNSFP